MTFREANAIALKELGWSDERISNQEATADAIFPAEGKMVGTTTIKAGQERALIEQMKAFFKVVDQNKKAITAALDAEIARRGKQN